MRRRDLGPGTGRAALGAVLALVAGVGCATSAPPPTRMLEPLSRVPARAPVEVDRAAVAVAAAVLTNDAPRADRALAELRRELDAEEAMLDLGPRGQVESDGDVLARESERTALLAIATDLRNSTLPDERAYRDASRELLASGDVDDALRARLEQSVSDDPLALANARVRDYYEILWADAFNTVSAPLGRSLITGFVTAPFEIAMSVTHYIARMIERPEVGLQNRQALRHWDDFLERYPDAEEADAVRESAHNMRTQLVDMQRDHFIRASEFALEGGQPRLARIQAERALNYLPVPAGSDDAERSAAAREVEALIARAEADTEAHRALRRTSLTAAEVGIFEPPAPRDEALLRALWISEGRALADVLRSEIDRRTIAGSAPVAPTTLDALEYALAATQREQGAESASWTRLDAIAEKHPEQSRMARHAAALIANPWQHPARAFAREQVRGTQDEVATSVLGGYAHGPRYNALPREVAYLIDAPQIAQTALSTPFRLLFSPLQGGKSKDYKRGAAIAGYRYIERFPQGEHLRETIDWLLNYEDERGNAVAALRLADWVPDFDRDRRTELAEAAAEQQLRRASEAGRRDHRASLLRNVVREFPDSQAGQQAGLQARVESEHATPQRIRLTRGFLSENPQVAGPFGLGLEAALIDGDVSNGELHPQGVTFLGGRILEFALIAESGDEDDEPETQRQKISAERLARSVALVEEAATLGVRLDADDSQGIDASRDLYFERARLGLTDEIDSRPTAESTYVYQGLRERYGMVRGRESILPFDVVLQGSLKNLGLGAFPRWRYPEHTPDAFLYR